MPELGEERTPRLPRTRTNSMRWLPPPSLRQERVPVPRAGAGARARSADMRYTGSVSNAFVQSVAHNFEQALRLMEAALTDCPDELWQTDLWPDEAPTAPTPHGGLHGSAPWFLGYHALNTLDYAAAAYARPLTASPRRWPLGHFLARIDTTECCSR